MCHDVLNQTRLWTRLLSVRSVRETSASFDCSCMLQSRCKQCSRCIYLQCVTSSPAVSVSQSGIFCCSGISLRGCKGMLMHVGVPCQTIHAQISPISSKIQLSPQVSSIFPPYRTDSSPFAVFPRTLGLLARAGRKVLSENTATPGDMCGLH